MPLRPRGFPYPYDKLVDGDFRQARPELSAAATARREGEPFPKRAVDVGDVRDVVGPVDAPQRRYDVTAFPASHLGREFVEHGLPGYELPNATLHAVKQRAKTFPLATDEPRPPHVAAVFVRVVRALAVHAAGKMDVTREF